MLPLAISLKISKLEKLLVVFTLPGETKDELYVISNARLYQLNTQIQMMEYYMSQKFFPQNNSLLQPEHTSIQGNFWYTISSQPTK